LRLLHLPEIRLHRRHLVDSALTEAGEFVRVDPASLVTMRELQCHQPVVMARMMTP
jgi:hypothetical protein